MGNLGWWFYKGYFKDIDFNNLDDSKNEEYIKSVVKDKIIGFRFKDIENDEEMLGNVHFSATTVYPGLVVGSGYPHELPDINEQIILGFDFDYTTGLPVIRGSSIKGVLKSAFKYQEYIQDLLEDREIDVGELEKEIFENKDIFFDAYIIKASDKILGDDYLTPHKNSKKKVDDSGNLVPDELCDPIPLRIIKVMPDVTFMFNFFLEDGLITKEKKKELFKKILADLGLGAKTNVGYGQFISFRSEKTKEEIEREKKENEIKEFEDVMYSDDLERLESFKRRFPKSDKLQEIERAIKELKQKKEYEELKEKFENLDKSNKKYIINFIEKYKNNPLAKEYIRVLKENFLENKVQKNKFDINDMDNIKNAKKLKRFLEKVDEDFIVKYKKDIEEKILKIYYKQKGKKRENFFKDAQLARFLGKDIEEEIKNNLT